MSAAGRTTEKVIRHVASELMQHRNRERSAFTQVSEVVWTTQLRELTFTDRDSIVQLRMYVEGCYFARPGRYVVSLYCEDQWVADTNYYYVSLEMNDPADMRD